MLEALEKLHECAKHESAGWFVNLERAFGLSRYKCGDATIKPDHGVILEAIADEIQTEIDANYMLLPVDADGVPWHIGDMTENRNVVNGIAFDRHGAHFISTLNDIDPNIHTHFKPRTLEDVLRDVWNEALDYAKSDIWRNPDEVFAERADEIRELLGGDV